MLRTLCSQIYVPPHYPSPPMVYPLPITHPSLYHLGNIRNPPFCLITPRYHFPMARWMNKNLVLFSHLSRRIEQGRRRFTPMVFYGGDNLSVLFNHLCHTFPFSLLMHQQFQVSLHLNLLVLLLVYIICFRVTYLDSLAYNWLIGGKWSEKLCIRFLSQKKNSQPWRPRWTLPGDTVTPRPWLLWWLRIKPCSLSILV